MLYSKLANGFFNSIHGKNIPSDAVEITKETYTQLLEDQSNGKIISTDNNGYPITISPAPAIQKSCTPAQGLVALYALKQITEDNVLEAISQIPDPVQQYTAKIGYQRATTWERSSPTMQAMAQLLQLSEEDLDDLFSHAATVQV